MSTTDTAISLCSRALILIGAGEISSFDDETTEAKVASELYGQVYRDLLTQYDWTFSLRNKQLAKRSDFAIVGNDWAHAFGLPDDFLKARNLQSRDPYELRLGLAVLLANIETPVLEYTGLVSELELPPYFVRALVYALAGEFALPVTEDDQKAFGFMEEAQRRFQRAQVLDAQSSPQNRFAPLSDFLDVRRGGGRGW